MQTKARNQMKACAVRAAQPGDFENISDLFGQLWPGKETNKAALRTVFDALLTGPGYEMVCADLQGKTVAFASLSIQHNFWEEGLILYITTMIVDEQCRNRGIGTALLKQIEKIALDRGCRRIELESAFHRTGAHAFYEKNGFVKRAYFFSKSAGER